MALARECGHHAMRPAVKAEFGKKTKEHYGEYIAMGWNPESQLLAMDRMGIDLAYLLSHYGRVPLAPG